MEPTTVHPFVQTRGHALSLSLPFTVPHYSHPSPNLLPHCLHLIQGPIISGLQYCSSLLTGPPPPVSPPLFPFPLTVSRMSFLRHKCNYFTEYSCSRIFHSLHCLPNKSKLLHLGRFNSLQNFVRDSVTCTKASFPTAQGANS